MYLWALFGRDPRSRPILTGTSSDLAKAMRAAEPMVLGGRAFIAVIEEARLRIDVTGLEENYVSTGRVWNGRRTTSGRVHWDARFGVADPAAVYRVPASLCRDTLAVVEAGTGERTEPDGGPPPGCAPR